VVDGHIFDSEKEARRYQELKLLVAAGEISMLELQPRFVLLEAFTERGRGYCKRHQAITYTADFQYDDGATLDVIVEDVKGVKTAVYNIKKKLFIQRYPQIVFREVR